MFHYTARQPRPARHEAARLKESMRRANVLLAACHGDAFHELLLEDQVQDEHGNHSQQAARHQYRVVGGELAFQGGQPEDRVIMVMSVLTTRGHIRSA